jgi:hypothetical protein
LTRMVGLKREGRVNLLIIRIEMVTDGVLFSYLVD